MIVTVRLYRASYDSYPCFRPRKAEIVRKTMKLYWSLTILLYQKIGHLRIDRLLEGGTQMHIMYEKERTYSSNDTNVWTRVI